MDVKTLSCTARDFGWSLKLPAVISSDPNVVVSLDTRSSQANYFTLHGDLLTIDSSKFETFIAKSCTILSEVRLVFKLVSEALN